MISGRYTERRRSRAGFTLIELMIASSISVWVLASIIGMAMAVWTIMRGSLDETQAMLHLNAVRQRLYEQVAVVNGGSEYTLSIRTATDLVVGDSGIDLKETKFFDGSSYDRSKNRLIEDALDKRSTNKYRGIGDPLQYIYLVAEPRKGVKSYSRMVVPILGRKVTHDKIEECFSK